MLLDKRTLGKKLDDAMLVDPKYSSFLEGLSEKEKENWQKQYSRYKKIVGSRSEENAVTRQRLIQKVETTRKEHEKIATMPTLDQAFFLNYYRSNPEKVEEVLLAANTAAESYRKFVDVEDKDVVVDEDEDGEEDEDDDEIFDEEDEDGIEEKADDDEVLDLRRVATLAVTNNETTSNLADKHEGLVNTVDTLNSNMKAMNETEEDQQEQINAIRQQQQQQCTPRSGGGGLLRFLSP